MGDLKARLLRASAGVNRGLSCREGEQEEIFQIVEDLEVRITAAKTSGWVDGSGTDYPSKTVTFRDTSLLSLNTMYLVLFYRAHTAVGILAGACVHTARF